MIRLGGMELDPDLSGVLRVPDYDALLVADLHFEKGTSFATRGIHLPPHDTRATLDALEAVLAAHKPKKLIALGDSFHDTRAGERLDPADMARIRKLSDRCEVIWITGNHDDELPEGVGGKTTSELALGPLTLRHIPSPPDGTLEIAGHLHPVASITRHGRRVRARCFIGDEYRLVMPAFGAFTGGLHVLSPAFAQIFPRSDFTAWMIGTRAVHAFPAAALSP
jgi:uncharacterized protein